MKSLKLFFVLLLLTFFSSCGTLIYYPNTTNNVHFDSTGEAEVSIISAVNGFDLQSSYALKDDVALSANLNISSFDDEVENNGYNYGSNVIVGYDRHSFGELGVFKWYDLDRTGVIGIGAGVGYGRVGLFDYTKSYELGYTRFFLQPYYGITAKHVEVYFTPKMTYLSLGPKRNFFLEPTFTLKAGFNRFKLSGQLGIVNQKGNNKGDNYINTQGFIFGLGMSYKFKK